MIYIDKLYSDSDFNDFLITLARKKQIDLFDDFKHDVFESILSKGYEDISFSNAMKVANIVGRDIQRKQMKHSTVISPTSLDSIMEL